jgi:hypothetical protein
MVEGILKEGTRVRISVYVEGVEHRATGRIRGVSHTYEPVIGLGYIIELDTAMSNWGYSCVVAFSCNLEVIEED